MKYTMYTNGISAHVCITQHTYYQHEIDEFVVVDVVVFFSFREESDMKQAIIIILRAITFIRKISAKPIDALMIDSRKSLFHMFFF